MYPMIPLTIAGSDPTAGAGIEADLLTFARFGLHGAAVATALTEQDTKTVRAVNPVAPAALRRRLVTLLRDVSVAGAKTGLIPSATHVRVIARVFREAPPKYLVVDPIVGATHGKRFLDRAAIKALRDELLPLATVLTPNLPEAAALLGWTESRVVRSPEKACLHLRALGVRAIVLKGGHAKDSAVSTDVLDDSGRLHHFKAARLGGDVHGTGCAFSAALLAALCESPRFLQQSDRELEYATSIAKDYVTGAIHFASQIGSGRLRLGIVLDASDREREDIAQ